MVCPVGSNRHDDFGGIYFIGAVLIFGESDVDESLELERIS